MRRSNSTFPSEIRLMIGGDALRSARSISWAVIRGCVRATSIVGKLDVGPAPPPIADSPGCKVNSSPGQGQHLYHRNLIGRSVAAVRKQGCFERRQSQLIAAQSPIKRMLS